MIVTNRLMETKPLALEKKISVPIYITGLARQILPVYMWPVYVQSYTENSQNFS